MYSEVQFYGKKNSSRDMDYFMQQVLVCGNKN